MQDKPVLHRTWEQAQEFAARNGRGFPAHRIETLYVEGAFSQEAMRFAVRAYPGGPWLQDRENMLGTPEYHAAHKEPRLLQDTEGKEQ
jgi:hypothetical protein